MMILYLDRGLPCICCWLLDTCVWYDIFYPWWFFQQVVSYWRLLVIPVLTSSVLNTTKSYGITMNLFGSKFIIIITIIMIIVIITNIIKSCSITMNLPDIKFFFLLFCYAHRIAIIIMVILIIITIIKSCSITMKPLDIKFSPSLSWSLSSFLL